jgi:hypothetical protein
LFPYPCATQKAQTWAAGPFGRKSSRFISWYIGFSEDHRRAIKGFMKGLLFHVNDDLCWEVALLALLASSFPVSLPSFEAYALGAERSVA